MDCEYSSIWSKEECEGCVNYDPRREVRINFSSEAESTVEGLREGLRRLVSEKEKIIFPWKCPQFEKVIFNKPATIILWKDGTKTVVKCMKGEEYDPEKGFAMAVVKKLLGEHYSKVRKKYIKPELMKLGKQDEEE